MYVCISLRYHLRDGVPPPPPMWEDLEFTGNLICGVGGEKAGAGEGGERVILILILGVDPYMQLSYFGGCFRM